MVVNVVNVVVNDAVVNDVVVVVNVSSYKKEHLTSIISWCKWRVEQKQPSQQPSLQHLAVTVKNYNFVGGGGDNPMRTSIIK